MTTATPIVRVFDENRRVPQDTSEVAYCVEALLTAYAQHTANGDWRDETGLDLEDSDAVCPEIPCLGGVVAFAGDDLDAWVALQWRSDDGLQANATRNRPGSIVAVVIYLDGMQVD